MMIKLRTIPGPNYSDVYVPAFGSVSGAWVAPPAMTYPLHMGGAIFTGLSDTTTLTLNVNTFHESFPSPAENDILVLATPSATYDPVALEMFSHSLSSMPVGVPASENGLGDWFLGAVADAAEFLAPLAVALGQPVIGAGLVAGGALARRGQNYLVAPSPQSMPRPNNNRRKGVGPPKEMPPTLPVKRKKKKQMTKGQKQAAALAYL